MTRLWAAGEPVQVVAGPPGAHDEGQAPARFQLRGEWHEVAFIANRWRVHTTWWRPEASAQREYFKLATSGGLLCVLYHDLQSGAWYCARVYD